ncbi:MAG: outer membrane beta-barrel protein [Prevotella sp.]
MIHILFHLRHTSATRWTKCLILLTVLLITTTSAGYAADKNKKNKQTLLLIGEVYDTFTKGKIKAFVTLMNADSTVVDTVTCETMDTRMWSYFTIKVPRVEKKYIIKTTAEGYEDTYTDYEVANLGRKRWLTIPNILMKRTQKDVYKDVELDGVVVKGTRIQVAYRGDTIVFDASAFKLPEGSMLDGLIRQLPGAELKDNGDIYINGKKIDFLTLNGKEFFKGDNKVMLENLPYFTVKDLKVFYRDTERNKMLGKEVDEKEYVMDVTLKREYARGYLVNSEAGAGTENRWMAKAFGMFYDDHTRLSLYGNANNVNEERTPGSDGNWDPKKVSDGVRKTRKVGMNLNTEDKDKNIDENLDVKLTWSDTDNEMVTFAETFADNGSIFSNRWSAQIDKNFLLHAANRLYLRKQYIGMYTYLRYTNYKSMGENNDSTYTTAQTNRNENIFMARRKYISLFHNMYKAWRFESGDLLMLDIDLSYNNAKPSESFNNTRTYYAATGTTEVRNRFSDTRSMGYHYDAGLKYNLLLPNDWTLQTGYEYAQSYSSDHNERFNLERLSESDNNALGWLPSLQEDMMKAYDTENSRSYNELNRSHSPRLELQRSTENMYFSIALRYYFTSERMNYQGNTLDTIAHRTWREFEPRIYFSTRGKTTRPIQFEYNTNVIPTSFASLMPLRDTSNPLSITISNPNLKNKVVHTAKGRITFRNDSLGSSVYVGFETKIEQNAVGNRTTYDAATGAYTRMTDNVDGNRTAFINSGWQRPLDAKKRFRMDIYGKAEYQRSVDFATVTASSDSGDDSFIMESPLSKVDNVNLTASAKFTYKLGDFAAGINGKITSRHTRGKLDIVKDIDANDIQYGFNATYTVPVLLLTFATDMTMYSRRGYQSSMMNTDELVWNAQLSRSFLKGALTAKVQAYDLLQKISSLRYNVNSQGRTETWYNYIPRYIMFSLAYRFSQKPNKR